jgi:hypothetical protein
MRRMRYIVALFGLLALTACGSGGSGTTTLHGTYTALHYGETIGQACSSEDGQGNIDYDTVTISVDGVPAAKVPVQYQGNVIAIDGTEGCMGTWSATVPTAKVAYGISMTGNDGLPFGTTDVSPADVGQSIALHSQY